jgi:hypothetical protein
MDHGHFDDLTRSVASGAGTRRAALRLMAGVTLGGFMDRFGLTDDAAAKAKKPKSKAKTKAKRKSQAERQRPGPLQAEKKGKSKKGKKKPPAPLPPGCQSCNECQLCRNGACAPDPALDGVRCLGSGAACGYCSGGVGTATARQPCADGVCPRYGECCPDKHPCSDGTCIPAGQCCEDEFKCPPDGPCVAQDQCCPGEQRCPDRESPTGFACVDERACCPGPRTCAGRCISMTACCEEDPYPECDPCAEVYCRRGTYVCSDHRTCPGGSCAAEGECCPEQWTCADGSCVDQGACCAEERRCPDGSCRSINQCCDGEKRCADGSCVPEDGCCGGDCGASSFCCHGACCASTEGGARFGCSKDGCCNVWFICSDGRCDHRCYYDVCDPPELCPELPPSE